MQKHNMGGLRKYLFRGKVSSHLLLIFRQSAHPFYSIISSSIHQFCLFRG